MVETETLHDTTDGPVRHWALISGGHDSLVAGHIAMEQGPATAVLHLDTNTGIEANKEYIFELCEEFNWPLRIEQAPKTLTAFAKEYGFPGPRGHAWAYRWFKERQLRTIARETDGKPHFWAGVRKDESENRMEYINQTGVVEEAEQWIWHKPLAYFEKEQCEAYIDAYGLPRNPVVANIHRSGECYCGAYATRDEELIDLEANYPRHFEWIKEVEEEVIEDRGDGDKLSYWGHGTMNTSDVVHLKQRENTDMMLCRDCRVDNQNSAGDTDW